jgi:hypothetical protein
MKRKKNTLIPALLLVFVGLSSAAALVATTGGDAPPILPTEPRSVVDLVSAQPFRLEQGYAHLWRAEQPIVSTGFLLVFEVEEVFTTPRNTLESVLYVGEQTAERLNWGTGSGRVVALVPTPPGSDGTPTIDWQRTAAWYGSPALPERVDAARITEELRSARAAGIEPLREASIEAALIRGGELLLLEDRTALERYAARKVIEFSPSEREWAEGFLAPLVR